MARIPRAEEMRRNKREKKGEENLPLICTKGKSVLPAQQFQVQWMLHIRMGLTGRSEMEFEFL